MKKYLLSVIVLGLAGCQSDAPDVQYYPDDVEETVYVTAAPMAAGQTWGANDDFAYLVPDNQPNGLILETAHHIIQIEPVANEKYAYVVWNGPKSMADTPDLIIANGRRVFDGSGGNNYYEFQNGDYLYRVNNTVVGTADSVPYDVAVYQNDTRISYEPAVRIVQ
ncbi:MAG: hypothetical protein K2L94_01050 [Alphaproteobacteria bacterium]|nr:hypothetical protein [Alphaproteobacteria bacterium]